MAAGEELCAFSEGDVYILRRGLNLAGVDLRTNLDGFVEAVADFERFGAGDESGSEIRGDAFLQQDAAGGGAALAGGAE